MKRFLLTLIRFYQGGISPFLGQHCRFFPSCSEYMHEAVCAAGVRRGFVAGCRRILRCHPFSRGGWDPVMGDHEGPK